MKTPLLPLIFDINFMPDINHPLVRAYIDPDIEITESHINCIYDAINIANEMMMKGE